MKQFTITILKLLEENKTDELKEFVLSLEKDAAELQAVYKECNLPLTAANVMTAASTNVKFLQLSELFKNKYGFLPEFNFALTSKYPTLNIPVIQGKMRSDIDDSARLTSHHFTIEPNHKHEPIDSPIILR
jgi:hypothetical protein